MFAHVRYEVVRAHCSYGFPFRVWVFCACALAVPMHLLDLFRCVVPSYHVSINHGRCCVSAFYGQVYELWVHDVRCVMYV